MFGQSPEAGASIKRLDASGFTRRGSDAAAAFDATRGHDESDLRR
jgi:hypothetical protein